MERYQIFWVPSVNEDGTMNASEAFFSIPWPFAKKIIEKTENLNDHDWNRLKRITSQIETYRKEFSPTANAVFIYKPIIIAMDVAKMMNLVLVEMGGADFVEQSLKDFLSDNT